MKKITLLMIFALWGSSVYAADSFFYFKTIEDDTFHYTRILRCNSAMTDKRLKIADAAGPFADFKAAEEARDIAIIRAKKRGLAVELSSGVCPGS
ncbi:MAG: hypothetical protein JKY66_05405 [Spongiibacteraceae bacterium]|nr:hypothetical protein [Spongiibacteraceae bacterium]